MTRASVRNGRFAGLWRPGAGQSQAFRGAGEVQLLREREEHLDLLPVHALLVLQPG